MDPSILNHINLPLTRILRRFCCGGALAASLIVTDRLLNEPAIHVNFAGEAALPINCLAANKLWKPRSPLTRRRATIDGVVWGDNALVFKVFLSLSLSALMTLEIAPISFLFRCYRNLKWANFCHFLMVCLPVVIISRNRQRNCASICGCGR